MKLPRKKKLKTNTRQFSFVHKETLKQQKKTAKRRNYFDCFLSKIERASANIVLCVQKNKNKKKIWKNKYEKNSNEFAETK